MIQRSFASFLTLALALAGCSVTPSVPRFALGPASGGGDRPAVVVAIAPMREALAAARSWHVADVYEYDVDLQRFDATRSTYADLPTPLTTSLKPHAGSPLRASFGGLEAGAKYRAFVTARGNAGGTAPTQWINASHPATADFDLGASPAVLRQNVPIVLDAVAFGLSLQMPSNASVPGSLPPWLTGIDASLTDLANPATPLAQASYTPDQPMRFDHVRGDTHYALALTLHSAAGQRTVQIPDYVVTRADGVDPLITPSFPPLLPPTGTLLASYPMPNGAFGLAIDAADHLFVANQHGNTVTEVDALGQAQAGSPFAVGTQPRGIAVDRGSGDVWVANFFGGTVNKIAQGVASGPFDVGFFPAGVAVDPAHRVWVANAFGNDVSVLDASGNPVAGSPFAVGSGPAGLAIDPTSGQAWVTNSSGNSVSRISAAGVVSAPLPVGAKPVGVSLDSHQVAWVVNNLDGTITRFKSDGSSGGPAIALGVTSSPTAIGIDASTDAVWVGLTGGFDGVSKLAPDGSLVGTYGTNATFPEGIAFDSHHNVWIAGGASGGAGRLVELAP